jgi:hypothetical protein
VDVAKGDVVDNVELELEGVDVDVGRMIDEELGGRQPSTL